MLSNVEQILNEFGERVTRLAKINIGATRLVKNRKGNTVKRKIDFTGRLRNSIACSVNVFKNSFGFYIEMEDYGKDVDQGKKAGVVESIPKLENWIRKKPARLRDSRGAFIKMTDLRVKSFAKHIAETHKKYGTAATNFISEPFSEEFKKLPDELIEAFGLDVDKFLEQQFR